MKNINLVSVIVVYVENDKKYLKNCLISLDKSAAAAALKLEFILVANGTSPINPLYLSSRTKTLKNKNNTGLGSAVNKAVRVSKGEWCLLTCPDVVTRKSCLKKLLSAHYENSPSLLAPRVIGRDNSVEPTILPLPSIVNIFLEQSFLYKLLPGIFRLPLSDKNLYDRINYPKAVSAIWWLFKKKPFTGIGGFDNRFFLYFEDADFCRRFQKAGRSIAFNPDAGVDHLGHKSTLGETNALLYYRSFKKYLSKHENAAGKIISLVIFLTGCFFRLIYWQGYLTFAGNKKRINFAMAKIRFCREVILTACGRERLLKNRRED